jgi:uncharacterized protein YjhX (UPF0386 family)
MVKTRRSPPESMRNTKTARTMVKKKGREGWMFFNPTIGTYQSRKMRKKRIKQVKTKSPMKILFLGLISKSPSYFIAECGLQNAAPPPQPSPLEGWSLPTLDTGGSGA